MKNINNSSGPASPYALVQSGEYMVVKYQPGINYKMLLSIFGIPESKKETIRMLMMENGIMPVNGDLRTKRRDPILKDTPIKLHKKYLESEAWENEDWTYSKKKAQDHTTTKTKTQRGASSLISGKNNGFEIGIMEQLSIFIKNKTFLYSSIVGGISLLVATIATAVNLTIESPQSLSIKKKAQEEQMVQEEGEEGEEGKEGKVEKFSNITFKSETSPVDPVLKKKNLDATADSQKSKTYGWTEEIPLLPTTPDGQYVFSGSSTAEQLQNMIHIMNKQNSIAKKKTIKRRKLKQYIDYG